MPRVALIFPDKSHYSTDYQVVINDINRADHLGADRLFGIMIEAQLRFIKQLGYANAQTIDGVGYIMADSEVVYSSESKHGDLLRIDVAVANICDKSFELLYRFYNETRSCDAALLKAGMVCLDYESGQAVPVPESFRRRFEG